MVNRADSIILFSSLTDSLEIRGDKQEIYIPLADFVSTECSKIKSKDYPYGRTPAHYLWIACQRMNILTEYFSYEEQELLLLRLQNYKIPKISHLTNCKNPGTITPKQLDITLYDLELL
jgi:hypothetical protein